MSLRSTASPHTSGSRRSRTPIGVLVTILRRRRDSPRYAPQVYALPIPKFRDGIAPARTP